MQYLTNVEILNLDFSISQSKSINNEEYTIFTDFLEKNIRLSQKLKEFSLFIIPIPLDYIDIYHDFLKQLCNTHPLLNKICNISRQHFNMNTLRLVLV